MADIDPRLRPALAELLLAVADDKLILGHRNSDWTGLAPILEEDIAFSSIAQDEIAHAQALYGQAGALLGRTADELAFGRPPAEFRCCSLVELPDDFDWAVALARQLFCDHFDELRLARLARSSHGPLAALCNRLHAEEKVHVDHADGWIARLGAASSESRTRLQHALDTLSVHAPMLAEPVSGEADLVESGVYPALPEDDEARAEARSMFQRWRDGLVQVVSGAGLSLELSLPADAPGGRRGVHTPHLKELLDEMCAVYRTEPDAQW